MTPRMAIGCLAILVSLNTGVLKADTIQLLNGDSIRGKVVSLDEKQLVFRSLSFGELKIGRDKIDLIVLGDKPLPTAHAATAVPNSASANSPGAGSLLNQVAPLLSTPAAQQQLGPMVEQLLGAGGLGDLQKNVETARRGLTDLKKDFGNGPESQALDAYINMFNILSPPAAGKSPVQHGAQNSQKNPQKNVAPPDKKG